MGNQGQVSVFIIIGVVAVLSLGTAMYLLSEQDSDDVALPEAERIGIEFEPVRGYVERCLDRVATQSLEAIGEHGGYVDLRREHATMNPMEPTESEGVFFTLGSQLSIPYWWHMQSENECRSGCAFSSSLRPPLTESPSSIETQIERSIEENLDACLGDYGPLKAQAFAIVDVSSPSVDVTITKNNVFVVLDMPLTVYSGDIEEQLRQFVAQIDVPLRQLYVLATNITRLEAEHHFLEKHIRNLIDAYASLEPDHLPPVSDMSFEIGPGTTWVKYNVQQKLEEILTLYIPMLKAPGSRNFQPAQDPSVVDQDLANAILNRGMSVPVLEDASAIDVRFTYLDWWPIYFDLNCRGQICQGENMINTFGFIMGLQRYNFAYDVSVPVLVELHDPLALHGKGYSFRFFLEANVRNNEPMTVITEQLGGQEFGVTGSMLCDKAQWQSGNMTIVTVDAATDVPVSVPVGFRCGEEACGIGVTSNGELVSQVPVCVGGAVFVDDPQYGYSETRVDIVDDTPERIVVRVNRPQHVSFTMKKVRMGKTLDDWIPTGSVNALKNGEQAIAILTRKGGSGGIGDFGVLQWYDSPVSQRHKDQSITTAMLVPGRYTVTMMLITSNTIQIKPQYTCYDKGMVTQDLECYTIPEKTIEFNASNPIIFGGFEGELDLTQEMIDAGTIELYGFAFDFELESTFDRLAITDLEQMGKIAEYSTTYADRVQPRVIS